jgi:hypothetical protein
MSTKSAPSKRSARTKGPNRGQAKSKIVVRRLPANLPEHVFMDSIKGLVPDSALDRPTTWVAGKVSKKYVHMGMKTAIEDALLLSKYLTLYTHTGPPLAHP